MKYKKPIAVALAAGLIGFTGCASQPAPDGTVNNNYRNNVSRSVRTVRNNAHNGLGYNHRYSVNRDGVHNAARNAANLPARSTNVRNTVNRARDGRVANGIGRYDGINRSWDGAPAGTNVNRSAGVRNNSVTRNSGRSNAVRVIDNTSPISQRNAQRQNVRVTRNSARNNVTRQAAPRAAANTTRVNAERQIAPKAPVRHTAPKNVTRQAAPKAAQQHSVNRQAPKAPVRHTAPKNVNRQAEHKTPAGQHTATRQATHNAPAKQHAVTRQATHNAPAKQHAAANQAAHNAPVRQHAAANQAAHNAPVRQHTATRQATNNAHVGQHNAHVGQHAAVRQAAPYGVDHAVNIDANRINRNRPQNVEHNRNNYYNASQVIDGRTNNRGGFASSHGRVSHDGVRTTRDGVRAVRSKPFNPDGTINNRIQSQMKGTGTVYQPGYPINRGKASNSHGDIITRGKAVVNHNQGSSGYRNSQQHVTNDHNRINNYNDTTNRTSGSEYRNSQQRMTNEQNRVNNYNDTTNHTSNSVNRSNQQRVTNEGGRVNDNNPTTRRPVPEHTVQRGTTDQRMTSDTLYRGVGYNVNDLAYRNIV